MQQLKIDRSLQDDKFSNWRLGEEFLQSRGCFSLPGSLTVADTGATNDYLHTRASLLHNHLHVCGDRVFLFTSAADGRVSLHEALPCPSADPNFLLQQVASALPVPDSSEHQPAPSSGIDLLVSCGAGDLRLVHVSAQGGVVSAPPSPEVHPLREPAPLLGVRPFKLEAAYWISPGVLRCVLWAVRTKTTQHSATCEVHLVTLATSHSASEHPCPQLQVTGVQLMARAGLPPHCVTCNSQCDSVMLGCDPSDLEVTPDMLQQPPAPSTPPVGGMGNTDVEQGSAPAASGSGTATLTATAGAEQGQEEHIEHIDCRPAWVREEERRAAMASAMDDDDDDIDPRTLAEAAARLAQYTSEDVQGPLPPQQWADLYKEGGPEDLVAESGCEMVLWRAGRGAGAAAGGAGKGPAWELNCGAHKMLSNDTPGLLAVTDDVDMCVLELSWGSDADAAQRGLPSVRHVATVPALAYVAAGKTQRKHLLVGPPPVAGQPPCPCSAVLVETSKFMYAYGQVAAGQHHAYQQVIDLNLASNERVLGSRLLCSARWGGSLPGAGRRAVVLVLTQRRLLEFVLCTPS